ncbi:MAG: GNAT family N-acetyltransferase [Lachnospiraceae bacterium]|nr:GNAT family N-acetyltransferase [Lachnospiraceae bacterium]
MRAIRVSEEWQRAGVYFVRTLAMCRGFGAPLTGEFSEDTPESEYILVLEGEDPVSTCRIRLVDVRTGKIERVVTLEEYRGQGYGAAAIEAAEAWLAEKGAERILVNSRIASVGFYEKLGYTPDYEKQSGSGLFACVMTEKQL